MTNLEIAQYVVDKLSEGLVDSKNADSIVSPHLVQMCSGYVAVILADEAIWDSEDRNFGLEDGDTGETALSYAETRIVKMIAALKSMIRYQYSTTGENQDGEASTAR